MNIKLSKNLEEKSVENQEAPEPKRLLVKKRLIAGAVLVFLIVIGSLFFKSAEEKNTKKDQEETSLRPEAGGRSIKRGEIMELFSEFRFREKFPVGDREYYLALSRDQLVMIQLLGAEEYLDEIIMTTFMDPNSTDKKDTLAGYQKKIREKITPNLPDSAVSELTESGRKIEMDEFEVTYKHLEYGDGNYSDSYSFKKIK